MYVHCTNVPVYVPCTYCILAESDRVTPVLTDPVAVEVVAQAAVCDERVKEVPVVVEEALGGGGVIVATLQPLGAGAVGFAVSKLVLAATTRRIVPPVENKASNLKYVHVY